MEPTQKQFMQVAKGDIALTPDQARAMNKHYGVGPNPRERYVGTSYTPPNDEHKIGPALHQHFEGGGTRSNPMFHAAYFGTNPTPDQAVAMYPKPEEK